MLDLDDARMVVTGATILLGGLGTALSTAVLGAALSAAFPGWDTRTYVGIRWAVRGLLRLFRLVAGWLVAIPGLVGMVFDLVKWDVGIVRRARWEARTTGRHRYSRVLAWSEGVRTHRGVIA